MCYQQLLAKRSLLIISSLLLTLNIAGCSSLATTAGFTNEPRPVVTYGSESQASNIFATTPLFIRKVGVIIDEAYGLSIANLYVAMMNLQQPPTTHIPLPPPAYVQ